MMPTPRAIGDGAVIDIPSGRDQERETLRAEIRRLEREVADARVRAERAEEDAQRAMGELRRVLSPLYKALQMVFGELDAAGVDVGPTPVSSAPDMDRLRKVWQPWIDRFGGPSDPRSRFILALLEHGELGVEQMKVAAQMAHGTVYDVAKKLTKLSLLDKATRGRYALRKF